MGMAPFLTLTFDQLLKLSGFRKRNCNWSFSCLQSGADEFRMYSGILQGLVQGPLHSLFIIIYFCPPLACQALTYWKKFTRWRLEEAGQFVIFLLKNWILFLYIFHGVSRPPPYPETQPRLSISICRNWSESKMWGRDGDSQRWYIFLIFFEKWGQGRGKRCRR